MIHNRRLRDYLTIPIKKWMKVHKNNKSGKKRLGSYRLIPL